MARKLDGNYITANTITTTQLTTTVVSQISAGGGPKVTTITYPNSATATVNTGNESIVLTGTGFEAGVQIYVNGAAVPSVSRTNSTSLSFTTPALSTGTTYPLYVVNPDGGTAVVIPGMVVSAGPVWVTESPLTSWGVSSALSTTLVANSDSTVSYALAAGSSLPSGITLAANGLLSGTLTSPPGVETTYNFTVTATDLEVQKSSKAFSITTTINPTFTISPAVSGISTWDTTINGALILDTYGTWTITPTSNMNANVVMWGAGGGGATGSTDGGTVPHRSMRGGGGGSANGFMILNAGISYIVRVGRGGRGANATAITYFADVGGGGAAYGDGNWGSGSGGAYTGVFRTSETQANAVMIAGGGGGSGLNRHSNNNSGGGAGGGTNGQRGFYDGTNASPGTNSVTGGGGTPSAGGSGATGTSYGTANSGGALIGGTISGSVTLIGSGGGSGYYGGGAGTYSGDVVGGGGGGSGFANSSVTSGVTLHTGDRFNPGNNTHPYFSNSGVGGTGNLPSNANLTFGANGRFVLISAIAA